MDSHAQEIVTRFEERIHSLIQLNEKLSNSNQALKEQLNELQSKLNEAQSTIKEVHDQYQRLVIAKNVSFSDEERKAAHRHLAALVRDVNACIELMNNNESDGE